MRAQLLTLVLVLAGCSTAPAELFFDAGTDATPIRPWILVTPKNVDGRGVPDDFVRVVTGRRVEVWADPNDPSLDLKAIVDGTKPR